MAKKNEPTPAAHESSNKLSLASLQAFALAPGEKIVWDSIGGETYGGGSNYLKLEEGQVDGPFAFLRIDSDVKLTEDSQPIDIPVALNLAGKEIRMPASAIFRSNFEEAEVNPGEVFFVMRGPDTEKKTGSKAQGKGTTMQTYSIKFPNR